MAEKLYDENMKERFNKKLRFLIILDQMKGVYRQTLLCDKSRRETDAEHSWHIAVMAMLLSEFAPAGADSDKAVKMCLVHDLVEIYAGDTFCYDEKAGEDKTEREQMAADRLFSVLPQEDASEMRALWEEFDEQATPTAVFAAALDRFQPLINNFLTEGHTWKKGKVKRSQVEQRMSVIRDGLSVAWDTLQEILDDSQEKALFTGEDK